MKGTFFICENDEKFRLFKNKNNNNSTHLYCIQPIVPIAQWMEKILQNQRAMAHYA